MTLSAKAGPVAYQVPAGRTEEGASTYSRYTQWRPTASVPSSTAVALQTSATGAAGVVAEVTPPVWSATVLGPRPFMAVVNDASEQLEEPGEVETQNVWYSAQTSCKTPVAASRRAVAAWSLAPLRLPSRAGMATAAKMAEIASTTISSTRVQPPGVLSLSVRTRPTVQRVALRLLDEGLSRATSLVGGPSQGEPVASPHKGLCTSST